MLKDPLLRWEGPFPYDALEVAGVSPDSSMREVLDASFELMAKGLMTPEMRGAWDELRSVERRQLVDFLLYQVDLATEVAKAKRDLEADLRHWGEDPDPSAFLRVDRDDLLRIEDDLRPIDARPPEVRFLSELDHLPPLAAAQWVELDR